jgi:cysteine desulfurase/selenocysteine lyase
MQAAIEHKLQFGVANIEAHNRKLTQILLDELRATGIQPLSSPCIDTIASMVYLEDVDGLGAHLQQNGVTVSNRMGRLRISMHYHNTEEDIQALIDTLKSK